MNRTLFIGDVHGCISELQEILDQFGYVRGKDTLYQTGDAINKGPDSVGVVKLILEYGIYCIRGNHEARLLRLMETPKEIWTDKEKKMAAILQEPEWLSSIVSQWPLWLDTPHALLVHAGIEPGKTDLKVMDPNIILTIRTWDGTGKNLDSKNDPAWYDCVKWPKPIVFGHWAMKGLLNLPQFKGLDSGCVYGRSLSAWCPEEDRIYSVPAREIYSEVNKKKHTYGHI
jgi:bis(5'-nucleosyl)-tetraphosphatase (symmetrical)